MFAPFPFGGKKLPGQLDREDGHVYVVDIEAGRRADLMSVEKPRLPRWRLRTPRKTELLLIPLAGRNRIFAQQMDVVVITVVRRDGLDHHLVRSPKVHV